MFSSVLLFFCFISFSFCSFSCSSVFSRIYILILLILLILILLLCVSYLVQRYNSSTTVIDRYDVDLHDDSCTMIYITIYIILYFLHYYWFLACCRDNGLPIRLNERDSADSQVWRLLDRLVWLSTRSWTMMTMWYHRSGLYLNIPECIQMGAASVDVGFL